MFIKLWMNNQNYGVSTQWNAIQQQKKALKHAATRMNSTNIMLREWSQTQTITLYDSI